MLRSVKGLYDYKVRAKDDAIGQVDDFFFDDYTWTMRYLVVDIGNWLEGRRVLISPVALGQPRWESRDFPVNLTKQQVELSPDIDTDQPVSRQMEERLHLHYAWPVYWQFVGPMAGPTAVGAWAAARAAREQRVAREQELTGDPHLRSVQEVTGYQIQARDDEIGHVADFIVEDESWLIRYLVVDTGTWLPGRQVLVAAWWIAQVDWAGRKVHVDLDRESIQDSPEFDPSAPVNREYETVLYDYYGRPKYWDRL
jgi:hypothetical protein